MRQIWIPKAGPPEVLELREADAPLPAEGEVRIRVEASGVNFADLMGRMGIYPDLPAMPVVPGYEIAGIVDAIGRDVGSDWLGRDVLALTQFGGYSDVICLPEVQVHARPAGVSAQQAAALPVNYLTAYQLMVVMGSLSAGETVLIHSAGGGVGIAAIQLARHIGAHTIGTASAGKHEFLESIGLDHAIDYRSEDFEKRVAEITRGRGVELVLDAVGGKSFAKSYRALAPSGRLGMFGMSASAPGKRRNRWGLLRAGFQMPWFRFNPLELMNSNKGVFGVNVGHLWEEVDRVTAWLETLTVCARDEVIQPVIAKTFPFEQAAAAHHYLHDRENLGKVLLLP